MAAPHRLWALWAGAAASTFLIIPAGVTSAGRQLERTPPTPNALHVLQLAFAQKLAVFPESPVID